MKKGNILVIDDEEVICKLIKDTLTEEGYSVTIFQDPKSGLNAAKQNNFDVILLDLRMPQIDGLSAIKEIKQNTPDGLYSMVIIITGYPSFETVQESLRLGVFDYITKPFELDELIFTVRRAVDFHMLSLENKKLTQQLKDLRKLYHELQASYLRTVKGP